MPEPRTPVLRAVLAASPGVVLGVAGLFHPEHLNSGTAQMWWMLHVAGMFVFPLVGVALASLVWPRRDLLAVVATAAAFVYAIAYNALDIISGITAGYITDRLGPGVPRPDEVRFVFAIGTPTGRVGEWALILACVLVVVDALRRVGSRALAGLLVLPGAWLVHEFHIYPPWGALGMALLGLGTGWLAWVGTRADAPAPVRSSA